MGAARPELGGMLSLPARVGAGTRVQRALPPLPRTGAASRGAWALLPRLLVRPIRSGLDGGEVTGPPEEPAALLSPAEASRAAPAFAKLAGQLPRALVRAGPAGPFGA